MGAPVLIGAGIGAATSLATGRDPLMGAALGGISGGAFGGSEGLLSGFNEGGLFTDGLFNVGDVASQVPQFGAVQGAEFTPNLLVDSAYNAPIGNAGMAGYEGSLGMFDQAAFRPQDTMYNYGAGTFSTPYPKFGAITDTGMATGGGYDPRLGVSQLDKIYQPNFTAIPGATMSGGGAAPGGSFADKMTKALSDSISNISASDAASGAVSAYNQLTPQQQQQLQPIIEQQLPSNPELVAQARMGNILDVKTEADKYKKRNLFYPTRTFA